MLEINYKYDERDKHFWKILVSAEFSFYHAFVIYYITTNVGYSIAGMIGMSIAGYFFILIR